MTTPDRHVRRTGDDYAKALFSLLPTGLAWPRREDTALAKAIKGLTKIFGYVDGRAADLLEIETDPRSTTAMLTDWERAWGLPDDCVPQSAKSEDSRRLALVTKMTLLGDQSRAFFIAQGALLGETVAIREYSPYMCGLSRCGDTKSTLYGDDDQHFRWQVGPQEMRFHWAVGIQHVLSGVECVFNRYRPAHTELIITYSSVLDRAMSTYYFLGI